MNRAQRVDEKNGVIFLVIMFTPGVIEMSKMAHFLYFLLTTAKNYLQFRQSIFFSSFRKWYG